MSSTFNLNGNVGIQTPANPSYSLDVNGNINFTNNLYKNGSIFLGQTGPQGNPGTTSGILYYLNRGVTGSATGYYQMGPTAVVGSQAYTGTVTLPTSGSTGVIAEFITDVNVPNALFIPAGIWSATCFLSALAAGGGAPLTDAQCYLQLFQYSSTGSQTFIGQSSIQPVTTTSASPYQLSIQVNQTVLSASDRLTLKLIGQNASSPTKSITITGYFQDSTYSNVITSLTLPVAAGPTGSTGPTGGGGPALFTLTTSTSDITITSANSIKKTGSTVGGSVTTTVESYPYNSCFLTFRVNVHTASDYTAGLSTNGTNIMYGVSLQSNNIYKYFNNGFVVSPISTYATNDIITVVVQNNNSYWYKNGSLISTDVLVSGTSALKARFTLYQQNDIADLIAFGYTLQGIQGPTGSTGPNGPIGGQSGQLLFNQSGSATGSSGLTYAAGTNTLYVANMSGTSINLFAHTGSPDPIIISSSNIHGGAGYAGMITMTNMIPGSMDSNKFIRMDNAGTLQILNSGYTGTILALTNAGDLTVQGGIYGTPKYCTAGLSTNQSMTGGADYIINMIGVNDPNGWWDNTNYYFKPTIAGTYSINYSALWSAVVTSSGQMNTQINKSGNQIVITQHHQNTGSPFTQNNATITYLNGTTDYVKITAYCTTNTSLVGGGNYGQTFFNAYLLN